MADEASAIGVFDSGVGGLTVFKEISQRLPDESIVYLGDTARVPYGTKSEDTVIRYAASCADILVERGIKLLVVACNTASAFALDALRDRLDVPVLGVIDPGAQAAVRATKNNRIAVIGTAGTIASQAYDRAIGSSSPHALIFSKACPLFVPLAEEGWLDGDVPRKIAESYLSELIADSPDTLVLGCTHYPLLANVIGQVFGPSVRLVDSAAETAEAVAEILRGMDMAALQPVQPRHRFLVTDSPGTFAQVGRRFLGCELNNVEWVDF